MSLVCPWWLGPPLASPLRRLLQDPAALLAPFVKDGMTVLEPGPGMGFFTLELARLVGPQGRVVCVDLQPRMLEGLRRRVRTAGLGQRVETRLAGPGALDGLAGQVDFVLAFAVVHELPDQNVFFREMRAVLKPQGLLLLAEPKFEVGLGRFEPTVLAASAAGFSSREGPRVWGSRTAILF